MKIFSLILISSAFLFSFREKLMVIPDIPLVLSIESIGNYIHPDSTYEILELKGKFISFQFIPAGFKSYGGGMVQSENEFRLGVSSFEKNSERFLILTQVETWNDGKAEWRMVHDVVILPTLQEGESIATPGMADFKENGIRIRDIVAIGIPDKKGFIENFRIAWRIDPHLNSFQSYAPDNLTCQLCGY